MADRERARYYALGLAVDICSKWVIWGPGLSRYMRFSPYKGLSIPEESVMVASLKGALVVTSPSCMSYTGFSTPAVNFLFSAFCRLFMTKYTTTRTMPTKMTADTTDATIVVFEVSCDPVYGEDLEMAQR